MIEQTDAKADPGKCKLLRTDVHILLSKRYYRWRLTSGEFDMKTSSLSVLPLIAVVTLASFALQGCNATAGLGRDVSAGADAVTESAEDAKGY